MDSKLKASFDQKDTTQIPITRIEAYCNYKYCDKHFFPCKNNSPGPTTYSPKLPRKHIAEADFTNLTPRKNDVLIPSYSVGPTSYNTHQYKSIKPIVETHNVKLKREAAQPKGGFHTPRKRLRDFIHSHRYELSLLSTFINTASESRFKRLEMEKELLRKSEEAAIVTPGERQTVVNLRKLLVQSRLKALPEILEPPLF